MVKAWIAWKCVIVKSFRASQLNKNGGLQGCTSWNFESLKGSKFEDSIVWKFVSLQILKVWNVHKQSSLKFQAFKLINLSNSQAFKFPNLKFQAFKLFCPWHVQTFFSISQQTTVNGGCLKSLSRLSAYSHRWLGTSSPLLSKLGWAVVPSRV